MPRWYIYQIQAQSYQQYLLKLRTRFLLETGLSFYLVGAYKKLPIFKVRENIESELESPSAHLLLDGMV